MTRFLTLIPIAVLFLAASAAFAAPTLQTKVVVTDEVVRLGDIFLGLDDTDIAVGGRNGKDADRDTDGAGARADRAVVRAPDPGRKMAFDGVWLQNVARTYGIAWKPAGPRDAIVIERASRIVGAGEIEDALRTAVSDKAGLEPGDRGWTVALDNQSALYHVPHDAAGSPEIAFLNYNARSGRIDASVRLPAGDTVDVSAKIEHTVRIPVLATSMGSGDIVDDTLIDWIDVPAAKMNGMIAQTSNEIVGMALRRPVRAGAPLRKTDLQKPVLVAKGEAVTVTYRTRSVFLTAQGKALQDGALGDVVRILNPQSKLVVEASVTGPAAVAVGTDCCRPLTEAGAAAERRAVR